LVATGDSSMTQPGVPRGMRRSGQYAPIDMQVYDRFVSTLAVPIPAGYLVPASDTAVLRLLRLHGIVARRIDSPIAGVEQFAIDSVRHDSAAFQGHRQTHLSGHWRPSDSPIDAAGKYFIVPGDQPLAELAVYLLEPESDDGLVTWNVLDPDLAPGAVYPVLRRVRE
jgi:hypothetical protein